MGPVARGASRVPNDPWRICFGASAALARFLNQGDHLPPHGLGRGSPRVEYRGRNIALVCIVTYLSCGRFCAERVALASGKCAPYPVVRTPNQGA